MLLNLILIIILVAIPCSFLCFCCIFVGSSHNDPELEAEEIREQTEYIEKHYKNKKAFLLKRKVGD